jgi:hypothetical protein
LWGGIVGGDSGVKEGDGDGAHPLCCSSICACVHLSNSLLFLGGSEGNSFTESFFSGSSDEVHWFDRDNGCEAGLL